MLEKLSLGLKIDTVSYGKALKKQYPGLPICKYVFVLEDYKRSDDDDGNNFTIRLCDVVVKTDLALLLQRTCIIPPFEYLYQLPRKIIDP
ncbi:Hypothetical protein CINCED_3A020541 [Cinara cedri]|uniref:Uncharacterized protein n=1 Tax=Cinara cedri TaxID=506608 RepID=A0A5E4MGS3_9HEMI|nr:Hypothetical protein CINCED_3A020541 [Cinara cedri]